MGEHYVGYGGTGSFTQSGGTKTSGYDLYLGYNSTDSGSYALSGGSLTTSTLTVGCWGWELSRNPADPARLAVAYYARGKLWQQRHLRSEWWPIVGL